jgi:hypothetical protein
MKHKTVARLLGLLTISFTLSGCSLNQNNQYNLKDYSVIDNNSANSKNDVVNNLVSYNWYKDQLTSDKDIEIYDKIEESLRNRETSFELNSMDTERFKILYKCVLYDNPDIFYTNSYKYIDYNNILRILPVYTIELSEIDSAYEDLDAYVKLVNSNITSDMSSFDKEKVIYDYIANNTDYEIDSLYNQSLYSVTLGKSVCLGYTKMFQYLCLINNIPCTIVTGTNAEGVGHAWNAVYIDDAWYMVDCTNSKGQLADSKNYVSYYYFNVTRDQILRTYNIDNLVTVPTCNSLKYEYYMYNDMYFDKVDLDKYKNLVNSSQDNVLTIRCSSEGVLNKIYEALIDARLVYDIVPSSQVEFMTDTNLLIFKISW